MTDSTELNLRKQGLQFRKVSLIEPSENFYLHIAAEIDKSFFPFYLTTSNKKKKLIEQCMEFCNFIEGENEIVDAVVFKARLIPPGKSKLIEERKGQVHFAKFDLAILIEAKSEEAIHSLIKTDNFIQMETSIKKSSTFTHTITASNIYRINSVDHKRQGVFLFNYFFADSLQQNLDIWEKTAGWFQQETGLDNSTVLLPTDQQKSEYTILNHCRWDKLKNILPSLIFKKSFTSYVLDTFYENKIAAMPVLYKIA